MEKASLGNLTPEQQEVVRKALMSNVVKMEMGAENWDLTEAEEMLLWEVIDRLDAEQASLKELPNNG